PATPRLSAEVGSRLSDLSAAHEAAVRRYFDGERRRVEEFLEDEWIPLFLKNFLGTSGILQDLEEHQSFTDEEKQQIIEAIRTYLQDPDEAEKAGANLFRELEKGRADEPETTRRVLGPFVEDDHLAEASVHIAALLRTAAPAELILDFAEAAHAEIEKERRELMEPLRLLEEDTLSQLNAAWKEALTGQGVITGRLEAASRASAEQDRLLGALGAREEFDNVRSR